jgi:hypothetical protein
MTANSELIDAEIGAYRDRDLESFVTFFSDDVIVTDFEGTVLVDGIDELRDYYGPLFRDSPELTVEIRSRIESGSFVVDLEHVEGAVSPTLPATVDATCIYLITSGKISAMKFLL